MKWERTRSTDETEEENEVKLIKKKIKTFEGDAYKKDQKDRAIYSIAW